MPASETSFEFLGVPTPIVRALAADGKVEAFPIQVDTLPDTLRGADVLGRGRTGSGKTLAFSIPLVAGLATANVRCTPGAPTGLVLAPTRELATQIAEAIAPLAAAMSLRVTTIFGGVKQARQEQAMRRGSDIVVACPGRLEDLVQQGIVRLDSVRITVLDEADHMADLGFLPGVTRILAATPADGQRLLFSATLDNGVDKLVKRFLRNPTVHSVDDASSPVEQMTHHVFEVASTTEKTALVHALASGTGRRILFTRTKHQAKKLARKLTADGIPAVDLHGNLSQAQRDRSLAAFGDGTVRVLVATDVAARGVHVDGIELVVHVDPPAEHKAYLHRSGRTARAGNAGDVVTLCLPEQRRDLNQLLRKAKIDVRPQAVNSTSPAVNELVGERAAAVAPSAAPAAAQPKQSQGGGRRGGGGRSGGPRSGGSRSGGARGSRTGGGDRSRRGSQGGHSQGEGQGGRSQGSRSQGGRSQGQARRSGGQSGGGHTGGNNGARSHGGARSTGGQRADQGGQARPHNQRRRSTRPAGSSAR